MYVCVRCIECFIWLSNCLPAQFLLIFEETGLKGNVSRLRPNERSHSNVHCEHANTKTPFKRLRWSACLCMAIQTCMDQRPSRSINGAVLCARIPPCKRTLQTVIMPINYKDNKNFVGRTIVCTRMWQVRGKLCVRNDKRIPNMVLSGL